MCVNMCVLGSPSICVDHLSEVCVCVCVNMCVLVSPHIRGSFVSDPPVGSNTHRCPDLLNKVIDCVHTIFTHLPVSFKLSLSH